jgi:hypothetical protein
MPLSLRHLQTLFPRRRLPSSSHCSGTLRKTKIEKIYFRGEIDDRAPTTWGEASSPEKIARKVALSPSHHSQRPQTLLLEPSWTPLPFLPFFLPLLSCPPLVDSRVLSLLSPCRRSNSTPSTRRSLTSSSSLLSPRPRSRRTVRPPLPSVRSPLLSSLKALRGLRATRPRCRGCSFWVRVMEGTQEEVKERRTDADLSLFFLFSYHRLPRLLSFPLSFPSLFSRSTEYTKIYSCVLSLSPYLESTS